MRARARFACLALLGARTAWTGGAPLPEPVQVQEIAAAVLHDRIYVAGGIDSTNHASARAFRFDPGGHRWEPIRRVSAEGST